MTTYPNRRLSVAMLLAAFVMLPSAVLGKGSSTSSSSYSSPRSSSPSPSYSRPSTPSPSYRSTPAPSPTRSFTPSPSPVISRPSPPPAPIISRPAPTPAPVVRSTPASTPSTLRVTPTRSPSATMGAGPAPVVKRADPPRPLISKPTAVGAGVVAGVVAGAAGTSDANAKPPTSLKVTPAPEAKAAFQKGSLKVQPTGKATAAIKQQTVPQVTGKPQPITAAQRTVARPAVSGVRPQTTVSRTVVIPKRVTPPDTIRQVTRTTFVNNRPVYHQPGLSSTTFVYLQPSPPWYAYTPVYPGFYYQRPVFVQDPAYQGGGYYKAGGINGWAVLFVLLVIGCFVGLAYLLLGKDKKKSNDTENPLLP